METLSAAALIRSLSSQTNPVLMLNGLLSWISFDEFGLEAPLRVGKLREALEKNPSHSQQIADVLFNWLGDVNIYPALINLGLFSRAGFFREMSARLYERINPSVSDEQDFAHVLIGICDGIQTENWYENINKDDFFACLSLLVTHANEEVKLKAITHFYHEGLYALEMLAIWIAAEEVEPDLMRLDKRLCQIDSPFIALSREMDLLVASARENLLNGVFETDFCNAHLYVMIEQSREQIERLRRRGAGLGSSLSLAHLLERLDQTLCRIELLLDVLFSKKEEQLSKIHGLFWVLVIAASEHNSVSALWRSSTQMLSKSITISTSGHGGHYITRTRSEFFNLIKSAAGAGLIIALMALIKIYIQGLHLSPLSAAIFYSLNYGIGFMLVHIMHFTIATKQPAMTASCFAQEVERGENGKAVNRKLAELLIDVNRSQWGAVWGNVSVAIALASVISFIAYWLTSKPLLDEPMVGYLQHSLLPFSGLALLHAAIAGVWLFCAGLIAGFFDNRANYLQLNLRLYHHPFIKRVLGNEKRQRFANYMHNNSGSLAGNFYFGVLLGMTGYLGYAVGLPLDIRHVAFSSANLGYLTVSGDSGIFSFLLNLFFVLLIGFVNLWVSFSLALMVALKARGTKISRFRVLLKTIYEQAKQKPLNLFFPVEIAKQTINEAEKNANNVANNMGAEDADKQTTADPEK